MFPRGSTGSGSNRFGTFQVTRDQPELFQRSLQVIDDLLRDHVRRRQVVAVGERFVAQPEDVPARADWASLFRCRR